MRLRRRVPAVADRFVTAASGFFDRTLSRRGFISKATVTGTAIAATGCAVVTQPGSPYTFVTDCPGGTLCRDGYTEFCCVINGGQNTCPPGTFAAGWWRADYSVFCNGTRYYIDCNDFSGAPPPCRCADGCDHRKVYCNHFRYGSCNDGIPGTGVIACRMVTCTPPYFIAGLGCSPSGAVDNSTAGHFADSAAYGSPSAPPPPPPPTSPPAAAVALGGAASPNPGELVVVARIGGGAVGALAHAAGAWGAWQTLALPSGRTAGSRVVAVSPASGLIDAFVVGDDGQLWWQHFEAAAWAPAWQPLGGVLRSDPPAAVLGGEVHVVARNAKKEVVHWRLVSGSWTVTNIDGTSTSDPAVAVLGAELHVFVRGTDSRMWTKRWNGSWSPSWEDLSGIATSDPAAVADASTVWAFVRGSGDRMYSKRRGAAWPAGWFDLGGTSSSDPAGVFDGSTVWLFARGSGDTLRYRTRAGGAWTGWQSLGRPPAGGLTTTPLATFDGSSIVVFARVGTDLHALRITGGVAGPWEALPTGVVVIPIRGATSAERAAMALVAGFLVFGIVVAIAAALVIREAGRIAREPPAALFDPDDAYEWVVEHVPDDVAATLTPDDVRRILELQIEFFQRKGVAVNGSRPQLAGPVVVGGAEQVAYILERSAATGEAYVPEQVYAVVETQLSYLRAIGAIGPPSEDDGSTGS